jgi:hypothetical protein
MFTPFGILFRGGIEMVNGLRRAALLRVTTAVLLASSGLALLAPSPASAAEVCANSPDTTWDGDTSSVWSDAANWDNGVPTAASLVCVPADMPNNPIINAGFDAEVDTIEVAIGATLNINGASLAITNDSSIATLTLNGVGTELTNNGALTVDTAFNMTQGSVEGAGSITSVIGANFATTSPKSINQNFTNEGILTWNDGDVDFGANTVSNTGQWRVPGTADTITAANFNNSGTLTKSNAGNFTIDADFNNSGTTTISGGSTFDVPGGRNFTVSNGEVAANGGTVDHDFGEIVISGGRTYTDSTGTIVSANVTVSGGTLTGNGTYDANVALDSGTLTAGNHVLGNVGSLDITNGLSVTGGTLRADLSNASTYDTVAVAGAVSVSGGQLNARGGTYDPAALTEFDVLTYSSISGTFSIIDDISNPNYDGYYDTDYGTSPLTLIARYNGTLNGYAFIDNNSNGVRDGGETTPRTGVTVYLDLNGNGSLDAEPSRSVNGDGFYEFVNITAGEYDVRTTGAPFGFVQSTSNPQTRIVPDQSSTTAHFGFYESISIAGNVFADNNQDGINNAGDGPADGVDVYLDLNANGSRDGGEPSETTNGSGNYTFSGLSPGTYSVRLDVPAGATQTTGNPGPTSVASGASVSGINFGVDLLSGSISGNIFEDTNGNGTKDGGENTVPSGAVAFLDLDGDGALDGGEPTASPDVDGDYGFSQIDPGTYDIGVLVPPGFTQTSAALDGVVLTNNAVVTGQNIGLFQAPGISGVVYSDVNDNGARDDGDSGLAGIEVFFDANDNGVLDGGESTVTTNANGQYNFDDLAGGTYKVRVVVPDPGDQTTADPSDITVTSDNGAEDVNFGLDVDGSVSGIVYEDDNGNGSLDPGEVNVVEGVEVFIDLDQDGEGDAGEPSTITGPSGEYEFTGYPAGNYDIVAIYPQGMTQTSAELDQVTIPVNDTALNQDVGLFTLTELSGVIYFDADEDGVLDSAEELASEYEVYVDTNNNGTFDSGEARVAADEGGMFTFEALGPGPHSIRPVLATGETVTTTNPAIVSLESGTPSSGIEVGIDKYGTIGGNVFNDVNGNGIRNVDDIAGRGNVTVFIDADGDGRLDSGEQTTTTDGGGNYTFRLISPGEYELGVVLGSGSVLTTEPISVTMSVVNQDLVGNDIGIFDRASISGRVFHDRNDNGSLDSNEAGVKGASVYIDANNNSRFDSSEPTVSTKNNGTYAFTNLGPGSHTVRVVRWMSATQLTPEPAAIIATSGGTSGGIDFGMDKGVVGSAAPSNQGTGYWMLGRDGRVYNFGEAENFGSIAELSSPAVGLAETPTGNGYWVATAGGGVQSFGDARYYGAPGNLNLNASVIDVVSTPTGNGYWVLAADGGVFAYGDAKFHGSTGSMRLNAPVVGMGVTGDGGGYWLVAADGGVFAFGNARFKGSMGGQPLNKPVVGIIGTSTGNGYLLVASDGGIFSYDAPFHGSAADLRLDGPIVGVQARGDGRGYWLVGQDGGLFAYGQAPFFGNAKDNKTAPIVG